MILYVHRNHKDYYSISNREPRTATSLSQHLSSEGGGGGVEGGRGDGGRGGGGSDGVLFN